MFLMQDDEDTGVKSKYDGMSESEILKAKKKAHPAEPEMVEKQQERFPARPETDETEQAMSRARKERVDEATETSITPFKSSKIAKAQQILRKIKNPVLMKKKHFPSGNAALDKIHKELKKTRKGQKKVLAENAEVQKEQSKVSETLTQLLNVVQQLAEDNKELKAKQESAERKLGKISLKQQETAPQEIHDLSDSEFDQSEPEPEDAPAKSSQAEKRKAILTEKEVDAKRRKASKKISKSRKAKEEAQKQQEEEPAKRRVSLSYDEYMERLKEQSLPLPSRKYTIADLDTDQQKLSELNVDSPYISAANMREVFLCKRAWGYNDKLSDTRAWIQWQKERYEAEVRLEAGKEKSENIITRIQLAISNHEEGVPVNSQFSPSSLWYKEWGEVVTKEKWNRSLWFLQDKLNLPAKVAEEVLYFYYVNSEKQLKEANPTRDRTTCAKLALADIFELQLNWDLWGTSKGKVLGD